MMTMTDRKKPNNVRTGLLLALVALGFFLAVFVNRLWGQG